LLQSALVKAKTPAQQARAQFLLTEFEYYEASALSFPRRTPRPTSPGVARQLLEDVVAGLDSAVAYAAKRATLLTQFAADPVLKQSNNALSAGVVWSGWNLYTLWDIATYIRDNPAQSASLRKRVNGLITSGASADVQGYARLLLDLADGKVQQLAQNPSFEDPTTEPWLDEHSAPPRVPTQRTTAVSRAGGASIAISGPYLSGGLSQQVPATPGFFRASFWFYTAPDDPAQGVVVPTWLAYDATGKLLQLYRGEQQTLSDTRGQWAESTMSQLLPDGVASIRCYLSKLRFGVNTTLYVDDVSFIQTSV